MSKQLKIRVVCNKINFLIWSLVRYLVLSKMLAIIGKIKVLDQWIKMFFSVCMEERMRECDSLKDLDKKI